MRTDSEIYSLAFLNKLNREKINTQSDYQRPEVWKKSQKQLLIDSIMRGYDIPKIYVKQEAEGQFEYEVIDGQQRLVAIWEFFDGGFALQKDAESVRYNDRDIEIASQKFEDLDYDLQKHFDNYSISLVVVTDAIQNAEEDEIGDLFLRLQNGTPLNAQEKRNAMAGNMRDFIKELSKHGFFEHSYFSKENRYNYDQLAAQLTLLEISLQKSGVVCNVTSSHLDRMYEKETNFDMNGEIAQKVKRTLDYLHEAFPNRTYELVNHSVITLYCLTSRLIDSYFYEGTHNSLHKWFMEFEARRRENNDLADAGDNNADSILVSYDKACSSATSVASIEKRLNLLEERFFEAVPDISQKDISED